MPNERDRLIEIVKSSLMKHIGKSCNLAENIVDDLLTEGLTTLPVAFSDNRRERMIELLNGYYEETGINIVHYFTDEESEMLADYILLDGWIRPPCKVGDTVYYPWIYDGQCGVAFSEVESIKIYVNGLPIAIVEDWRSDMPMPISFTIEDFGKTVFLTKEEAEAALKTRC